jgi:hypothetical protein
MRVPGAMDVHTPANCFRTGNSYLKNKDRLDTRLVYMCSSALVFASREIKHNLDTFDLLNVD